VANGTYEMYGQACLTNFDWAWCPPIVDGRAPDIRVELGGLGRFATHAPPSYQPYARRAGIDPESTPVVDIRRGSDGHYRVSYVDGAEFVIDHTASEIFGVARGKLTLDDLIVYLQGPVLGFALRLRGVTCLHGSAVVSGGRAFAVVGQGGMGKSTSAATFAALGLEVLTDDVLALADDGTCFHVQPGLPRVFLWPASVAALFGEADALPRVVSSWDKRYLDLTRNGYRFARRPAPLRGVYVLGARLPAGAPPEITPLTGTAALPRLLANTYANDFLDVPLRAEELRIISRLVAEVPIRSVRAPDDLGALPGIAAAILADFDARP